MVCAGFQRADPLKKTFLKCPADAHHLARCLHLRRQMVVGVRKFIKRKPRKLGDHIVQGRFKGCRRIGYVNLIKGHADADLGGYSGDGIAAGLGCER